MSNSFLKEQATGSSHGGKNTKIHVLINEKMQLLKVVLTGGFENFVLLAASIIHF